MSTALAIPYLDAATILGEDARVDQLRKAISLLAEQGAPAVVVLEAAVALTHATTYSNTAATFPGSPHLRRQDDHVHKLCLRLLGTAKAVR